MPGLYPNDASILDTAGRIIIVLFFVTVGLRNLSSWQVEDHVKRLEVAGTPMPRQTFWAGVVLEFIGCQNGFISNVCICGGLLLLLQRVM